MLGSILHNEVDTYLRPMPWARWAVPFAGQPARRAPPAGAAAGSSAARDRPALPPLVAACPRGWRSGNSLQASETNPLVS